MSEIGKIICTIMIVIFIFSSAYNIGKHRAMAEIQNEVIKCNHGEYYIDSDNEKKFRFK